MPAKTRRKRMVVFDLLRGFFMFGIIVNHLGLFPNLLTIFTGATKLWVSMAEGFFMVSGFFIGFLYKERIKKSFLEVFTKLIKRSWRLYLWTVYLTFLFVYWGNFMPLGTVKTGLWIVAPGNLLELIGKVLTYRYTYGWADILPLYSVFVFFSPFVLFMLHKGYLKLVILLSIFLWFVRGQNIYLAVQILFFLGVIVGFYSEEFKSIWAKLKNKDKFKFRTILYGLFLITLFTSITSVYLFEKFGDFLPHFQYLVGKNRVLNLYFDKQTVAIGRLLLSPLWVMTGYFLFSRFEKIIIKYFGKLILAFGKNSLYAYILHAFVIFPIPFLVHYFGTVSIWWNTFNSILAVGCVYLILLYSSDVFKGKF